MDIGVTVGDAVERIDRYGPAFDFVELGIGEGEVPADELAAGAVRERLGTVDCTLCVHLPFSQDLVTPVPEINDAIVDFLDRLLRWAGNAGAMKAVLHCTARNPHDTDLRPVLADQLTAIDRVASQYEVELVLENVGHQARGVPLSVVADLAEQTKVSVCFDIGHAFMEGKQDAIDRFLKRHAALISHLHLHDVRSRGDTHLPLGAGEIDFSLLSERLPTFDGTVAVEVFADDAPLLRDSRDRIRDLFVH